MIEVSPEPNFDLASGSSDSVEQLLYWSRYAVRSDQKSAMVRAAALIEAMREQLEEAVAKKRATKCTDVISGEICRRLAAGESLQTICKSEHLPCSRTVFRWVRANAEFKNRFESAREAWARSKA